MNRRGFVAGLGSLAMAPALPAQESRRHAGRMKITEVRLVRLKVVRGLGTLEPAWFPGRPMNFQVGGGAFRRSGQTWRLNWQPRAGRRSSYACTTPL